MKIYSKKTVLEAALERIRYLFDEFPNIIVGISGGKDSTVIFNLALQVAKEKNRLPLSVMWIDQEAEWQGTVDYVTSIMTRPDVKPYWFQMPMVITNNASSFNRFSYCWAIKDKDKWIHPQHELSIKENKYGTERFHDLFQKILGKEFKNEKSCYLAGVRTEESPKRFVSLTSALTYKWITWGKVLNKKKEHYTFYPIYDWSYTDVWKFINDNGIGYNKVYDKMYQLGLPITEMRVSNLHHETAIRSLITAQEIEAETWNKLCERIDGASSIKHIQKNSFTCPTELPNMFNNWEEYAMYLSENIIQDRDNYEKLNKLIEVERDLYSGEQINAAFWKTIINTILSSDWDFTKFTNWKISPLVNTYRRMKKNSDGTNDNYKWTESMLKNTRYITNKEIQKIQEHFNGNN